MLFALLTENNLHVPPTDTTKTLGVSSSTPKVSKFQGQLLQVLLYALVMLG